MLSQQDKDHYQHQLHVHSIPPTLLVQPVDKGQPTHPIPKPRFHQGRARLRTKFKTHQPIPLPKQMPAQPITTHVPKAALSLPEPVAQLTRECVTSVSCTHTVAPNINWWILHALYIQ